MTVPTKEKKREARREEKAEKAAVLEKVRLFSLLFTLLVFLALDGIYGTNTHIFCRVLKKNCSSVSRKEFTVISIITLLINTTKSLTRKLERLLLVKMKRRRLCINIYASVSLFDSFEHILLLTVPSIDISGT